jgi:hypothetical protein
MTRKTRLIALALVTLLGQSPVRAGEAARTLTSTGWFSDVKCASARVADGRIGPTGLECSRRCIASGVKVAFIDEKAKEVLEVDNPAVATLLLGDHVKVEATRPNARTIHVTSVKVLSKYAAKCDVH